MRVRRVRREARWEALPVRGGKHGTSCRRPAEVRVRWARRQAKGRRRRTVETSALRRCG
jgi:hypothetical protein